MGGYEYTHFVVGVFEYKLHRLAWKKVDEVAAEQARLID
jgi:hypothetical protein